MTLVWLFARGKWYDTNLSVLQNLNSRIEGMKHQQMENLPYRLIHRQKEIRNEKERERNNSGRIYRKRWKKNVCYRFTLRFELHIFFGYSKSVCTFNKQIPWIECSLHSAIAIDILFFSNEFPSSSPSIQDNEETFRILYVNIVRSVAHLVFSLSYLLVWLP